MIKKKHIVLAGVSVVALWGLSWLMISLWDVPDQAGTFGDMFGAINALFSGLAFAGLIITILLQREDISIQRKLLEEQKEEITLGRLESERQGNIHDEQRKLLNLQRVEGTVMQLVKYLDDLNEELSEYHYQEIGRGEKYFRWLVVKVTLNNLGNTPLQNFNRIYETREHHSLLDRYFKTVFYTLNFINDATIGEDHKKTLGNMVNFRLSDEAITSLYLYCGTEKQFELVLLSTLGFLERHKDIEKRNQH